MIFIFGKKFCENRQDDSTQFLKLFLIIIFYLISLEAFGQIYSDNGWSTTIKQQFELIKKSSPDTLLIYYSYLGPWNDLSNSCNGIPSVWVLWTKDNMYYAKKLFCDSITFNIIPVSSAPFKFFVSHIKDFKLRDLYIKKNKFLPPVPTDGSWEFLVLTTVKNSIYLNLSEHQKTDSIWKNFAWIEPTIEAIEITKKDLN